MNRIVYDYQIFASQQFGGISRYICELAMRVRQASDFESMVIAPLHFNNYLAACNTPRIGWHLPLLPHTQRIYRATNRALSPAITRVLSPSLVHRTYFTPLPRPRKTPVVITVYDMIHEIFAGTYPKGDRTSQDKRRSLDEADHILSISESTASDLVHLFGIPRSKISVTHLGYSEIFSAPAPLGEVSPHARPYILYVGNRWGYKNFDLALNAYASSLALRASFDLVMFGGPPLGTTEQQRITGLGLSLTNVVRLSGSDVELARAYRHARAFVYPSRYEGFGIPPLEAMAAGCPVVASDVSSIPEVVGPAALMFPPDDVDAARSALESACFDNLARDRLVAAGRRRATTFSWDRCALETLALYRRILSQPA
ncbi:glycosyltransferase family 1 protein [Povalibacter sp.]|uniref:glycosyltransferase family 4 protein n=1 Tax=Povalibacter sp. TaxID=1962978 RepID=UPI002F3F847B